MTRPLSKTIGGAVLGGAVLMALPATAQDQTVNEGPNLTARLAFDLEVNDNFDLREDSVGTGVIGTATLGFGLQQETQTDSVNLTAQGSARGSDFPEIGTEFDLDDPRIGAAYTRTVDDTEVGLSLRFQSIDLAFFDPLSDVGDEGNFDGTRTEGRRTSLRAAANMALNQDGPVSFDLGLTASSIDFTDSNDPDDEDRNSVAGRAELGFDVSPTLRLTTGAQLRYEQYPERDEDEVRRVERADIGAIAQVNPVLDLIARIGYSRAENDARGETRDEEGVVGDLSFVVAEPRGETRGGVFSTLNENGTRTGVTVGKRVEFRNADLDGDIGLTLTDDNDVFAIGDITYSYALRASQISLSASQQFGVNEDGEDEVNTLGSVAFRQFVTERDSFDLALVAGLSRLADGDTTDEQQRVNFTARYNRAITRDWSVNFGYRGRFQDETDEGRATSNAVFVGVARDFAARR